ncbi:hypothetical protein T4E_10179 [Trichinella pseudospiralis]|uniref:Uncharacterized protein n=1 Tax=Trichinella pseudospiralis TaxID=6337 RepID=A0A0V0XE82_TRIPS|nr:hypothetical protein T4E_10033 [Trichinella pseudospiralis]KRX86906.1 hypothetical protein T4E_10179 [Trichinella pseudospiralis]
MKKLLLSAEVKLRVRRAIYIRPFSAFQTGKVHDSASRHILIFAAGSNIRLLAAMKTWNMDSTFQIVLQWYQQLFIIHAFVAGKLVPAVYSLCTGKDIGTYGSDSRHSGLLPKYAGTGLLLPLLPGGT